MAVLLPQGHVQTGSSSLDGHDCVLASSHDPYRCHTHSPATPGKKRGATEKYNKLEENEERENLGSAVSRPSAPFQTVRITEYIKSQHPGRLQLRQRLEAVHQPTAWAANTCKSHTPSPTDIDSQKEDPAPSQHLVLHPDLPMEAACG